MQLFVAGKLGAAFLGAGGIFLCLSTFVLSAVLRVSAIADKLIVIVTVIGSLD